MDDAGPPSLFVAVSWFYGAPYFSSIVQLETQANNLEYESSHQELETEFSVHFRQPQPQPDLTLPIVWAFSPLASSTEDLYMLPDWSLIESENDVPLHGCIFNLRTRKCKRIKPPQASKYNGNVVTLGGHIYFMAHPSRKSYAQDPVFERYNPLKDSWEKQEPFPRHAIDLHKGNGKIVATAVWDDTILLNVDGLKIWAYNVCRNKWYPVKVKEDHDLCYCIVGEAVVLGNTIYALTEESFQLVLALSIEREEINGDLVFKCSLLSEILVAGMDQIKFEYEDAIWCWSPRHLVHLGKDNFCLVRSIYHLGWSEFQCIQLTNIKLEGENSMTVKNTRVYKFKMVDSKRFQVRLCISLPKCKTTASEEGKKRIFKFDPFPKRIASKLEEYIDFNTDDADTTPEVQEDVPKISYASVDAPTLGDGDASERSNTDEEGHSIYVRNLPRNATVRQLEMGLKEFGSIKRAGIKVRKNRTGKSFAFVEFESAASKGRAIKASPITIGGCEAEIEEKRRTGLTLVDCNKTSGSSSSFGKNKYKDHARFLDPRRLVVITANGGGYQPRRPKLVLI